MSYKNTWLIEDYVVQSECSGHLTIEDITALYTDVRDHYLNDSLHLVHLVFVLKGKPSFPNNLRQIREVSKIVSDHDNMGWMIVVGLKNPIISFFAGTVGQLVKLKIKEVPTLDEALGVLRRVDPSLPEVSA